MFADLSLENRALKDVIEKALNQPLSVSWSPSDNGIRLSIRQACRSLNLQNGLSLPSDNTRDEPVITALRSS